jgi:ATP phosphoribosyltransferase
MDLATPGIVAVHALVPASQIWSLLPQLQACGASSILTLPVERMMP